MNWIEKRYNRTRKLLIFICLFISIGAFAGGLCLIADPSGKIMGFDEMWNYFQKLPFANILFQDFLFSGISLVVINGITNIIAATLLIAKKKQGIILGAIFGVTLMLWICIQFYFLPPNFMSILFFIIGLFQLLAGIYCFNFYKQTLFYFDESKFTNVGNNDKFCIVYFSRMNYVKTLAYKLADESGAYIYEITTSEKTDQTAGFFWCGRFSLNNKLMPIDSLVIDLTNFENVTICTPIWNSNICSPIKTFAHDKAKELSKIKNINLSLVHFQNIKFKQAAEEFKKIIKRQDINVCDYSNRFGNIKKV